MLQTGEAVLRRGRELNGSSRGRRGKSCKIHTRTMDEAVNLAHPCNLGKNRLVQMRTQESLELLPRYCAVVQQLQRLLPYELAELLGCPVRPVQVHQLPHSCRFFERSSVAFIAAWKAASSSLRPGARGCSFIAVRLFQVLEAPDTVSTARHIEGPPVTEES